MDDFDDTDAPVEARELGRALARGELSAEEVAALPAQSLYLAVQTLDMDTALEVLEAVSEDTYRLVLDFDLWQGDSFEDDRFWEWLIALEQEPNLQKLARFVSALDPGLLGLLVARYARVVYSEEPSDPPPGPGYFTPDGGSTWIGFNSEDQNRIRLLGKLFALLYTMDASTFYQVLVAGSAGTPTEFEEESFQERSARLGTLGIPDHEQSAAINASLPSERAAILLRESAGRAVTEGIPTVHPLIRSGSSDYQPLLQLLEELSHRADLQAQAESELTLIANASLVFYAVPFSKREAVAAQVQRLKGSINIGLEQAAKLGAPTHLAAYEALGFVKLYQLGLHLLRELQRLVRTVPPDVRERTIHEEPLLYMLCVSILEPFPLLPAAFGEQPSEAAGVVSTETKPFSRLHEVTAVEQQLRERFHH